MIDVFMIDIPLIKKESLKIKNILRVKLTYKETSKKETVCFQNFDVFNWIADDVLISKWSIISVDGETIDCITEGTSFDSLSVYVAREPHIFN